MQPASVIVIRQPTPADGPAIEEMFARCSVESRYARFLAPLPTIPADHLARVLAPPTGNEAWVGVTSDEPEKVVALGSWARLGTDAGARDHRRGLVATPRASAAWSSGCWASGRGARACAG